MRVSELWEKSRRLRIFEWATQKYCEDLGAFNDVVRELVDLATRDLRLEGYPEQAMRFDLDLEMRFGSQYNLTRVRAPRLYLESPDDYRALGEHFVRRYGEIYSPEATFLAGGINIESFCVGAWIDAAPFQMQAESLVGEMPVAAARTGTRPACWDPASGFVATPVYDLALLQPGNVVAGPAIIEARETTYVIEPGWSFRMDAWRNGVLETRASGEGR
ncbi:MAG: hypothetical protein U1F30_09375 [Steroidobacteraceae bacterium]